MYGPACCKRYTSSLSHTSKARTHKHAHTHTQPNYFLLFARRNKNRNTDGAAGYPPPPPEKANARAQRGGPKFCFLFLQKKNRTDKTQKGAATLQQPIVLYAYYVGYWTHHTPSACFCTLLQYMRRSSSKRGTRHDTVYAGSRYCLSLLCAQ